MILTGIADEASDAIEGQICAHRELGWQSIELRLVDGKNIAGPLADAAFDQAARCVEEAGMSVPAFASAIGNWSRPITGDFARDVQDLRRTIPRMHRLGAKYLRTMSWARGEATDEQWRRETLSRYRELARIAEDGGVYLAHENCTGWAGQSPDCVRELIEEVDSGHLVVLFDMGNTISHGYDPWSYYTGVKDLIRYVHVKDCQRPPGGGPSQLYAYPGKGDAMVQRILRDLLTAGYDGVISIEPHVAKLVHDASVKSDPQQMYDSYLRYAREFIHLIDQVRKEPQPV